MTTTVRPRGALSLRAGALSLRATGSSDESESGGTSDDDEPSGSLPSASSVDNSDEEGTSGAPKRGQPKAVRRAVARTTTTTTKTVPTVAAATSARDDGAFGGGDQGAGVGPREKSTATAAGKRSSIAEGLSAVASHRKVMVEEWGLGELLEKAEAAHATMSATGRIADYDAAFHARNELDAAWARAAAAQPPVAPATAEATRDARDLGFHAEADVEAWIEHRLRFENQMVKKYQELALATEKVDALASELSESTQRMRRAVSECAVDTSSRSSRWTASSTACPSSRWRRRRRDDDA